MPLNPQARAVLDVMATTGFKLAGDPAAVRAMIALTPRPQGEAVTAVEDRTVPTNGAEIPVRIYRPDDARAAKPAFIWFHGGGWVIGSLDGADFGCRMMANASGCVVISVDYRLAPEHKFPTAVDDCMGVTQWIARWKRNGWQTANKQPVKNQDLWERLDRALADHQVDIGIL